MARKFLMVILVAFATLAASADLGNAHPRGTGPGWHGGWGGHRSCCWRGGRWGWGPGWGWRGGWGHPGWGWGPGWGWRTGWVWVPGWGWTWR